MQNKYLEMMEATQKVISRANDISATAEKVTNMLGIHKDDLARMAEVIGGRFQAIRTQLIQDEEQFLAQIDTLTKELDGAVAALRGSVEPEATAPEVPAVEPASDASAGGPDGKV
jgi:hypothetical protein